MKQYKTIAALKGAAKTHMFGNYGPAIGAYILMNLSLLSLTMIGSAIIPDGTVGQIIYFLFCGIISLISGVYTAGNTFLYLNIASGRPVQSNMVFYGFMFCAEKALILQAITIVIELIVSLPLIFFSVLYVTSDNSFMIVFVIIGFIISIAGICLARLVLMPMFYLLHDFPNYSARQIVETSMEVMKGNVGRLFLLNVHMIPLQLLELLSFGIGALWVETYKNEIMAEFFLDLMRPEIIDEQKGI